MYVFFEQFVIQCYNDACSLVFTFLKALEEQNDGPFIFN